VNALLSIRLVLAYASFSTVKQHYTHYVDGFLLGKNAIDLYLKPNLSISLNLWFSPEAGELNTADMTLREYYQDVDWVFYCKDMSLSTIEVANKIDDLRKQAILCLNNL